MAHSQPPSHLPLPLPFSAAEHDCADHGELCFNDNECCWPYECDNRSMYCTAPSLEAGTPEVSGDSPPSSGASNSYGWIPTPSPTFYGEYTLPPVGEPNTLSFNFDEEEETLPEPDEKPSSDEDCEASLSDNMKVGMGAALHAKDRDTFSALVGYMVTNRLRKR